MDKEYEKEAARKVFWHRIEKMMPDPGIGVVVLLIVAAVLVGAVVGIGAHYMNQGSEETAPTPKTTIPDMKTYSVIRHSASGELDMSRPSLCCQAMAVSEKACEGAKILEEDYSCRPTTALPIQTRNTCMVKCSDLR